MTRIRSQLGPTMAVALGTGIVTGLGGAGLEVAALIKGGLIAIPVHVLAFLLLAATALLLAVGLLGVARLARYGEAWLEIARDRRDGALHGAIEAALQPTTHATAVLTFVCRRVTSLPSGGQSGSGGNATKVLHQARVEVPRSAMIVENARVRIPFRIELPRELPEPGLGRNAQANSVDVRWDLTCHVDAPGLALRVPFELVDPPASYLGGRGPE